MPRCLVRFAQGSGRGGGELRTRLAGPQLNVSRYTEADGGEVVVIVLKRVGWLSRLRDGSQRVRIRDWYTAVPSVAANSMGPPEAMLEARRPRMDAGTVA